MPIESKIRMNQFTNPQDFLASITELKKEFKTKTEGSVYSGKELILSQECERVVFKGMEHLFMNA
jgi:hypothetical protein